MYIYFRLSMKMTGWSVVYTACMATSTWTNDGHGMHVDYTYDYTTLALARSMPSCFQGYLSRRLAPHR